MIAALFLAATLLQNAAAVTNAAHEIDAAIVAKGGTTAGGLTNAAAAIAALPSGGGGGQKVWDYPADWPVAQVKAAWTNNADEAYNNRVVLMIPNPKTLTLTFNKSYAWGVQKVNTSDGATYTEDATHTFVTSDKYVWLTLHIKNGGYLTLSTYPIIPTSTPKTYIYGGDGSDVYDCGSGCYILEIDKMSFYNSSPMAFIIKANEANGIYSVSWNAGVLDIGRFTNATTQNINQFYNRPELRYISSLPNKPKKITNWFSGCKSLRGGVENLDSTEIVSQSYDMAAVFNDCCSLTNLPTVLHCERAQYFGNIFSGCSSTVNLPNELILTNATAQGNIAGMFAGCTAVNAYPTRMEGPNKSFSYTISMADLVSASAESFATMAANLNDVNNDGGYTRTLTLPTNLREKFSDEAAADIISAANAKGWTLGNFAQ